MRKIDECRAATTLPEFAKILKVSPSALSYVLYIMPAASRYTQFTITKRNGSPRLISAPSPRLKLMQSRLNLLLSDMYDEAVMSDPKKGANVVGRPAERLQYLGAAHGFAKGRSIHTNAYPHTNRRYVLNLDIKDFFGSINFGRVRGFFIKDREFLFHPKVATLIAQIACFENMLPQGSPCSPILSNLIGGLLDVSMNEVARKHKLCYTRYADDLTFSTNAKDLPSAIGMAEADNGFVVGKSILRAIHRAGFSLNEDKVRLQFRGSQQSVTGLVVNEKVNISQLYYKRTRAMCHALFYHGAAYRNSNYAGSAALPPPPISLSSLEGRLGYIYHTKLLTDGRPIIDRHDKQTGITKIYRRFLFWKNFIANDKPVLLCEGKTDNVYLKNAIKRLPAYHASLGVTGKSKFEYAVSFFGYTSVVADVLRLAGGTSFLCDFIIYYKTVYHSFYERLSEHPVIMIIDNDDGAAKIFSVCKKKKINPLPDLLTTDPFYYVCDNLYIVKTLEVVGKKTCIEDCFEESLLKKLLGGKVFNPHKEHDAPGEYGKALFANEVVRPLAASIKFDGFAPLLDRIIAARDDFYSRKALGNLL